MSEEKWTREQLRVINGRGTDMLVSASAGSGKTTVMIRRIIALIQEGASLADMAVCTFTKASAADMRSKLYVKLKELSAKDKRFSDQLALLPQAQISTIHSFCQQLIKTYFYALDVDPDFEILDETEASAMLTGCAETAVEKFLSQGDADFLNLYEVTLKKRDSSYLVSLIKQVYSFAACQEDFLGWLDGCLLSSERHNEHIDFLKSAFAAEFAEYEKKANELLSRTANAEFYRNLPACEALAEAVKRKEKCAVFPRGKKPDDAYLLDLADAFSSLKEKYNKFAEKYAECISAADPKDCLPSSRVLVDLTRYSAELFAAAKRKKAALDYSDLEHCAIKILSDPETRAAANEKYKFVFVDEYQDVNPLQESLIKKLKGVKFFVGDVKQSIYAFRMCDSAIFLKKYAEYKNGGTGEAIELNANFRSDEKILSFCNDLFSDIMTEDFGKVNYALSARFAAGAGTKSKAAVSAELAVFNTEKTETEPKIYSVKEHINPVSELNLTDAETELVTRRIESLLSTPNENGERVSPADVVVLLRAVRGEYAAALKKKLAARNISAFVSDSRAADKNPDVAVLIAALKFINNGRDDLSLCAVMRSYLGGFTDDDIAEIRETDDKQAAGGDRFFYEAVRDFATYKSANPTLKAKTQAFYTKFARYVLLSKTVKVSRLLGMICAENDYFKYVYSKKGGDASAGELANFLDIVENSSFDVSLDAFLKSLEREMPVLEAVPPADAVRIMTIHASKGLEFKHVILGNVGKKFDKRDLSGNLLLDSELGLSLKRFDDEEKAALDTSLHLRIRAVKERKAKEEEMRVLYVALTRAENSLYICGSAKELPEPVKADKAESFLEWLYPHIKNFVRVYSQEDFVSVPETEKASAAGGAAAREYDEKLKEEIKKYIAHIPRVKNAPLKTTVTAAARDLGDEEETAVKASFADGERGTDVGTAYHLLMQEINFDAEFENEKARLSSLYPAECALVNLGAVEKAAKRIKELCAGNKYYRELPFLTYLDSSAAGQAGGGKILVQGVIDLLIDRGDECVIVDYKSGAAQGELLTAYEKQVSIYALAAQQLLKKTAVKKYLYSFSSSKLIEI